MASEVFTAREGRLGTNNSANKSNTRSRQRSAIQNAVVKPSEGWTTVNLGNGQSVNFNVHYINSSSGTVTGQLNMRGGSGSNRFRFGGNSGMSFDEALSESKKDIINNIMYYE